MKFDVYGDVINTPEEYVKSKRSDKALLYKGPRTKEVVEDDLKRAEKGSLCYIDLRDELSMLIQLESLQ